MKNRKVYYLSDEALKIIQEYNQKLGVSYSNVVELALRSFKENS